MTVLYVTSQERGEGKTALCASLAAELKRQGKGAVVFKPLAAPGDDHDADMYQRLLGQAEAPPQLKASGGSISGKQLSEIESAAGKLAAGQDLLLVEGSSAFTEKSSARLAEALSARVLVVERHRPGLDGAQLARWKTLFGERLLGLVINGLGRYMGTEVRSKLLPSIESDGLLCLGVVPENRRLLAVSVGQFASHLEGRFIAGEEFAERQLEHFMIGGMGMDSGEAYFGTRNQKAVIVRGDRPDIQMAALQTPTSCLLLTNGVEPIEYVLNEAELEEVPIVVVDSDTPSTMASLNTVHEKARFDHPAKLERFGELLREHVQVGAIYADLGQGG